MTTTLNEQIGQLFLVGFEGLSAPDHIVEWLREGAIGGVILFARNVASPQQLAELTGQIHEAARTPALIAIDQEGGVVARLREGFTESPGAMALSACGDDAERYARAMSRGLADEMRALGINWTYAPAVDLAYNAENPTIGTRSFGSETGIVSRMTAAAVAGFQAGGVAACAKHFPGLGDTAVDTHVALAVIDKPVEALIADDLPPYRAAIAQDVASLMTTHTLYTTLDGIFPATLSPVIIQRLIREALGYDGVVTSDCMEMRAISDHYTPAESAVLGVLAGLDVVLYSHTRAMQEEAMEGVRRAVESGRIPRRRIEDAYYRVQRMKARYRITAPPTAATVRDPARVALADEIARRATTLYRYTDGALPLRDAPGVALVEFASILESEVVESGGCSGLGRLLAERLPSIRQVSLLSGNLPAQAEAVAQARRYAAEAETLVIATRNAHLIAAQLELAQELAGVARRVIVLCLRNPYDAPLFPQAQAVICTLGDSAPSLGAAVAALAGEFVPGGVLPVAVG